MVGWNVSLAIILYSFCNRKDKARWLFCQILFGWNEESQKMKSAISSWAHITSDSMTASFPLIFRWKASPIGIVYIFPLVREPFIPLKSGSEQKICSVKKGTYLPSATYYTVLTWILFIQTYLLCTYQKTDHSWVKHQLEKYSHIDLWWVHKWKALKSGSVHLNYSSW